MTKRYFWNRNAKVDRFINIRNADKLLGQISELRHKIYFMNRAGQNFDPEIKLLKRLINKLQPIVNELCSDGSHPDLAAVMIMLKGGKLPCLISQYQPHLLAQIN